MYHLHIKDELKIASSQELPWNSDGKSWILVLKIK